MVRRFSGVGLLALWPRQSREFWTESEGGTFLTEGSLTIARECASRRPNYGNYLGIHTGRRLGWFGEEQIN
jgi:hypothetical protein